MAYDFKSLSSHDFELLVRDLLQAELKVRLESFKPGKDRGIDLRFSTSKDGGLIVQCKHWARSSVADLVRELRDKERPKIEKLAPKRYILATSLPLSPADKDALLTVLAPFALGPSDILGMEDLNNLLSLHVDVERQHYKLWLTSEAVLQRVLHSGIYRETDVELEGIRKRLCRYVESAAFPVAREILDRHGYCIISGPPGIGKTTLAEVLLIHYAERGYEPIRLTSSAKDAWQVLRPSVPQVFYYDDFLGQTAAENKLDKNEDQALVRLANLAARSKTTKLILTTREYILNAARQSYEPLGRWDIQSAKCVVTLQSYTRGHRAKILFNHIYFSTLPHSAKTSILADRAYVRVVDHPNFSPRLIDSILAAAERNPAHATSSLSSDLLQALENPADLWRHAFENQISPAARSLLTSMVGLPDDAEWGDLREAAESFRNAETTRYSMQRRSDELERALRELDGSFLRLKIRKQSSRRFVEFASPAVREFVELVTRESNVLVTLLLDSAAFFEQLSGLWGRSGVSATAAAPFRPLLRTHAEAYLKALDRTFEARSPRFISIRHRGYNQSITLEREKPQTVDRFAFLVSLAAEEDLLPFVAPVLKRRIPEIIGLPHLAGDQPEKLAHALADLRRVTLPAVDLPSLARQLMSSLRRDPYPMPEMFGGVVVLVREFEELFRHEMDAIRAQCEENVSGEMDALLDNCDTYDDVGWVEDGLSTLETISRELSIDISADLAIAKQRLHSLLSELPGGEEHDDAGWSGFRDTAAEGSDAEIDDLFGHLRDRDE